MNEKTLKFDNIRANKKEFHSSKQPIGLMSVNVAQIVVSDKFKHSDKGFKYFIGYQEEKIVKPLCIILFQMSGYIKYFENGGKTCLFWNKDDEVWRKYDENWDVNKNKLGIKFHSKPVHEQKYLKANIREFDVVIKPNFLGNDTLKENMHYACIACITVDSAMRMDKKTSAALEKCKYRIKKIQMSKFISAKLKSDSESDSESRSDTELMMTKLESNSDSE